MEIQAIGSRSLYASNPDDVVKGYIDVQNDYDSQIVDVLWAYGTFDGSSKFVIEGYALAKGINFPGMASKRWESGSFYTPNNPGTWDLFGILADDLYFDENGVLIVVGQHGPGFVERDGWTISVAAELKIINVGVRGS